ncbi:hypothetical protein FPZ42_17415 [Mucilaginibacter achroorhodeus]|uniref:Uncharacterized protein n=1 Tax=Mucilaginibacter achroorhodeus TaxID=2599294 RepID=A0A563TZS5_9SPHI|nr:MULTISPECIES: hypothetical protein [Mucilaginibacter]QXV66048.1 hypothetical protein INP83_02830 [Mucilaginibacter sp. 21P]TWR24262.1 hypothetical protein FPZ42_17415 [Mucilaginibacter achroorhodeus]
MRKLFIYLAVLAVTSLAACKGNSTGQTGGAKADSGATNVGSSGATPDSAGQSGTSSPTPAGTSGTDTSTTGKGVTNPTVDTTKK